MTVEGVTHIIVGAGSAGCVLAYRLSERPENRVLLLEAGPPDRHPFIHMPKGVTELLKRPRYNWYYPVDRGPGVPSETWIRGRTLGGSSSVNGMMYTRGQVEDFDLWESLGNSGWGRADMLRAYKALETHEYNDPSLHGTAGPLRVSLHDEPTPVFDTLLTAMQEEGIPLDRDIGVTGKPGAGFMPRTIYRGRRVSAARAFLKPARTRGNLKIVTNVEVERLLIENGKAVGVAARHAGRAVTFRCEGEVILSAGALHSPKLLLLSGIGPADELRALGIEPVVDSPNVGRRLREHLMTYTYFRFSKNFGYTREVQGLRLIRNVLRYYATRRGLLSWTPMELAAFFKTAPERPRADALVTVSPILFNADEIRGSSLVGSDAGVTAFSYYLHPESEGSIKLTGSGPKAPLHIRPNYLSAPQDIAPSVAAFRALRRIFATPSLAPYGVEEIGPVAGATSDEEIVAYMRRGGKAALHTVGTCRMGNAAEDVVDTRLRVRGIERLRVVDVSVLPTLPQHTNGPAMAVGWRGSDFIMGRD